MYILYKKKLLHNISKSQWYHTLISNIAVLSQISSLSYICIFSFNELKIGLSTRINRIYAAKNGRWGNGRQSR